MKSFFFFFSIYLPVSGAVFFDGPASFVAESLEDLVVVAVLWELIVAVHPQTGVDLRGDGSAPPLPPLVVFPLLPRRHSRPRRHFSTSSFLGNQAGWTGTGRKADLEPRLLPDRTGRRTGIWRFFLVTETDRERDIKRLNKEERRGYG